MNIREILNGFKSLEILECDFSQLWREITATWFYLTVNYSYMVLLDGQLQLHGFTWRPITATRFYLTAN
jgi:hypothetical protein